MVRGFWGDGVMGPEEGGEGGSEKREWGMGRRHCYFWIEVESTEELDLMLAESFI